MCGCGIAVLGFSGKAEVSARWRDCAGSVWELVIGVAGSCVAVAGAAGTGCGIWVGAFGSGEASGGCGLATAGSGCTLGCGWGKTGLADCGKAGVAGGDDWAEVGVTGWGVWETAGFAAW